MRKVMVATTAADRGGPIPDGREKGKERTSRKAAMSAAMKNCPESGAISGPGAERTAQAHRPAAFPGNVVPCGLVDDLATGNCSCVTAVTAATTMIRNPTTPPGCGSEGAGLCWLDTAVGMVLTPCLA